MFSLFIEISAEKSLSVVYYTFFFYRRNPCAMGKIHGYYPQAEGWALMRSK